MSTARYSMSKARFCMSTARLCMSKARFCMSKTMIYLSTENYCGLLARICVITARICVSTATFVPLAVKVSHRLFLVKRDKGHEAFTKLTTFLVFQLTGNCRKKRKNSATNVNRNENIVRNFFFAN